MAVTLPLIDICSSQRGDPVLQNCAGVRIEDTGAGAALVFIGRSDLVKAVFDNVTESADRGSGWTDNKPLTSWWNGLRPAKRRQARSRRRRGPDG
jgi:hypothetical protein